MRQNNRICAMLLIVAMLLISLCSCGIFSEFTNEKQQTNFPSGGGQIDSLDLVSTKTAPAPIIPAYSGKNTLTAAVYEQPVGAVSPFYAETEVERLAADLSHVKLLTFDRSGTPVVDGREGAHITYLGTEYTYNTIADVDLTINEDGTVDYDFTLREDVFFSDGTNLSADDVIFSMYVLLDPSYTGNSEFSRLPIIGLDSYHAGMSCLGDMIYDSIVNQSSSEGISDTDKQRFLERIATAQQTYITGLLRNLADDKNQNALSINAGKWVDKLSEERYLLATAMVIYGYAVWEKGEDGEYTGTLIMADGVRYDCVGNFPEWDELFAYISAEADSLLEIDKKHPEGDLNAALKSAFGSGYEYFFEIKSENGKSASAVSGITKTGMYSLKVKLDRYDVTDINGFSIYVAPLHAYGNRESYKYTEHKFGFIKGNTGEIKNKKTRVSSGAYIYRGENGDACRFERNKLYYLGCPYITYIDIICIGSDENVAVGIAEGKYDIASSELSTALLSRLSAANKKETAVSLSKYSNGKYAYIGLNCDSLRVGEQPSSARSISLRRAFCTVLSYYSDVMYEGDVSELSYPVSAPIRIVGDDFADVDAIYGKDPLGENIFTEGMSEKEKTERLRSVVLAYFVEAGYTLDKKESKIEASPDDGELAFSFAIFSDGVYSDYVGEIVKNTQKLLSDIGITLTVEHVSDLQTMYTMLNDGNAQMWSFTRTLDAEPNMTLFYSKNSPKYREGTGENYSRISDKEIDALLGEIGACVDTVARMDMYRVIFEKVLANAVEVPLCISYGAFLSSAVRFEDDFLPRDITSYYSWTEEAHSFKFAPTVVD